MSAPSVIVRPLVVTCALVLAACGAASEDPCTIAVGGMSITPAGAGSLGIAANEFSCDGADGTRTLACSGAATLASAKCSDGFAFTLESGNATLLLRFKGGDSWQAGAQLAGAAALEGSISFEGISSPDEPVPASGKQQAGSFALHSSSATFTGTLLTTW